MTIVLSLVSSLIAALFAAFIAHYLATSRMRKNDLTNFQLTAYSDFIGAASRLAVSRRLGNKDSSVDDLSILNDSKNRIIVSGDREIVEALIEFWGHGGTLEGEIELLAFKNLSQLIRASLGHKKHDIYDLKVSNTMFKLEPSSFSFKAKYDVSEGTLQKRSEEQPVSS